MRAQTGRTLPFPRSVFSVKMSRKDNRRNMNQLRKTNTNIAIEEHERDSQILLCKLPIYVLDRYIFVVFVNFRHLRPDTTDDPKDWNLNQRMLVTLLIYFI